MTRELILPPGIRENVLDHLKRAGHDSVGQGHISEDGNLIQDSPGCLWGMWLVDMENLVAADILEDDESAPRTQCTECLCGYSDVLDLFQPGEEERERVEYNELQAHAETALRNRLQFEQWKISL